MAEGEGLEPPSPKAPVFKTQATSKFVCAHLVST